MKSFILFCLGLITIIHDSSARDHEQFCKQVLEQHNVYRAEQCAGPLQRDPTIDRESQSYCEHMAKKDIFAHSNRTDYGENSYQKIPFDAKDNGATPVVHWYSEKANYTVTDPGKTLHFTQLVWKATKTIGCGVCDVRNNGVIVVVNYSPRGNYENQFAQNVGCSN